MKIEITTEFDTSYNENYSTKIIAKIVTDKGVVLCEGEDKDAWPDPKKYRASAKEATRAALNKFEHLLKNAQDVAKKSGLV